MVYNFIFYLGQSIFLAYPLARMTDYLQLPNWLYYVPFLLALLYAVARNMVVSGHYQGTFSVTYGERKADKVVMKQTKNGLTRRGYFRIQSAFYYLFGFCVLLSALMLAMDIVRFMVWIFEKVSGYDVWNDAYNGWIILAISLLSILLFFYGAWHFFTVKVRNFHIQSERVKAPFCFVHVTDVQYGTISTKELIALAEKVQKAVDENKAQCVLFTGDFVDNEEYNYESLKSFMFSVPTFFVMGNHDYYHDEERIINTMTHMNYQILRNERDTRYEAEYGISLVGIDDPQRGVTLGQAFECDTSLIPKHIDSPHYNILMYHRPEHTKAAAKFGFNLMLTGHTHGGQIIPNTWLTHLVYDVKPGLHDVHGLHVYLSMGIGLWGPRLRIGTSNEFAVFTISPKKTA